MAEPRSDVRAKDVTEGGRAADIVPLLNQAIALEYAAAIQFVTWEQELEDLRRLRGR